MPHIIHLYNVFLENDGSENCAKVLEEEFNKMYDIKSLDGGHDCNVVSMNSLNIHDANDMQSHKLGDAMFDEDDIFSPPRFDVQICYNDCMPPIYDDYIDESGFGRVSTLGTNDPGSVQMRKKLWINFFWTKRNTRSFGGRLKDP